MSSQPPHPYSLRPRTGTNPDDANTAEQSHNAAHGEQTGDIASHGAPHDNAAHNVYPGDSIPHDDTSHATATPHISATPHSTLPPTGLGRDDVARLKAMLATATRKSVALLCEEEQLGNSPEEQERRTHLLAEITMVNKRRQELTSLLEHAPTDAPASTAAPVRAAPSVQRSQVAKFLPRFRCGKEPIHEPERFLTQFKRVLDAQDVDVEKEWYHYLILCMTEDHGSWVEDNLAPSLDWKSATNAFTRQFGDPSRVRQARLAILKLQMRPGETLSDYAQRFESHLRMADVPDTDRLAAAYFLSTLPPELHYHIDSAVSQLEESEPSVKQLIRIALSYMWKPPEAKTHTKGEGPRSHSVPGRRVFCQLHGLGNHATNQCRSLHARLSRANPGAADVQPASSTSTSATADAPAPTRKVTCYHCGRSGHYANECRQRAPTTHDKPSARRATVVTSATDDDPLRLAKEETADGASTFVPVLLNGQKYTALLDSGATHSLIAKSLVDELGVAIEPRQGLIKFADGRTIPRVGVTAPIRTQTGTYDHPHSYEVIKELDEAQLFIGHDLLTRVAGPDYLARKFTLSGTADDTAAHSVDAPTPLVPSEFNEEELSPEFRSFREGVMQAIEPELAANAAIPHTSFCPLPEAVVRLPTEPGRTTYRRQYPLPQTQHAIIAAKLRAWLDNGVIEIVPTASTFNTPCFLVPKKGPSGAKDDFRICLDFRSLNALLPSDRWPLPLIGEIFEALAGAQVFSTLDLYQAYHRFPIAAEDRFKTAFTWNGTQYQFRGAPFGLKILPSQFQRTMAMLLRGLDFARVFIDDVVVFSKSIGEHADHLVQVIRRLNQAQLILNVAKCDFARTEVNLLGFKINALGRRIDPTRLVNLVDWPKPTTAKQLRSFLGFVGYLRDFVPNIATITAPLNAIRARDSIAEQWTSECERAFQLLKELIPQCPPLAHPDFEKPFFIATDASAVGIAAVLFQLDPESETRRFIQFQARALSKSERNYSATKRELLAVVFAFARFHHYIYGRRFTLYTDHHALVHLQTQPRPNAMMQGWFDLLFEHDFDVIHLPGIHNVLPDALSRLFPPLDLEGEGASANAAVNSNNNTPAQRRIAVREATATIADPDARPEYTTPPRDQRADIVLRHHLRGHFGVKATVDSIREAGFDWPKLADDVRGVCIKCLPCQRHNISKRGYHPLSPISADQPFDHIAIDLAGPFPVSPRGNTYLLVLIDIHSRFACLRAIPDKCSPTIGATLFHIFTSFGFPKIIQSDQGTEFVNSLVKHLADAAKIDHRLITPYHPRANGLAERTVQSAVQTIKKLLDGAQNDWDATVPFVQYALNTKVATIHRSTPFAVMYGRRPNLFADHSATRTSRSSPVNIETRAKFMRDAVFPGIAKILRTAQDSKKSTFDSTHTLVDIPVDSYVMVIDNTRRRKLDPRYEGPFKVIGRSGGAYTLQDNAGALLPRNFPPSALRLISADPVLNSPSFEVDAILDHRLTDSGYEYLVHWKGYSKEEDSWEPAANFDDEATITSYWKRRADLGAPRLQADGE
jgi:hypothetical protein